MRPSPHFKHTQTGKRYQCIIAQVDEGEKCKQVMVWLRWSYDLAAATEEAPPLLAAAQCHKLPGEPVNAVAYLAGKRVNFQQ